MNIALPLLTAFLFMSFSFTYYYENTVNGIKSADLFTNESKQIELAATGMELAKEALFNDLGWDNCLGAEKNCKDKDEDGFYKLYSASLQKTLKEYSLNNGTINVYAKNIDDKNTMVISEGIYGDTKTYIGSVFNLVSENSAEFIPTMYTNSGTMGVPGRRVGLCTYLYDDNEIKGQINTNTTLYWGDGNFNNFSVKSPSSGDNVEPDIDRNVKVVTNRAYMSLAAPGGDEIYSTGDLRLTRYSGRGYEVDKAWANGDLSFDSGVSAVEQKSNGNYIEYPDFKEEFEDYTYDSSNYTGTLPIPEGEDPYDFSSHKFNTFSMPTITTGLTNIENVVNLYNGDNERTFNSRVRNNYYGVNGSDVLEFNKNVVAGVTLYNGFDIINFDGRMRGTLDVGYGGSRLDFDRRMEGRFYSYGNGDDELRVTGYITQDIGLASGNNKLETTDYIRGVQTDDSSSRNEDIFVIGGDILGYVKMFGGNDQILVKGNIEAELDVGTTNSMYSDDDLVHIQGTVDNRVYTYNGNDVVYVEQNVASYINMGSGDDYLRIDGTAHSNTLDLGEGHDDLYIGGDSSSIVYLYGGDDEVIINGRIWDPIMGGSGTDSIQLNHYTRDDYDNNVDRIKDRIIEFENINFSDGINIVNGADAGGGEYVPPAIVCNAGQTLNLDSGVYASITIHEDCKLVLTGEEYYVDNLIVDGGTFDREAEISFETNTVFHVLDTNISDGGLNVVHEGDIKGQFSFYSEDIRVDDADIKCVDPKVCLFTANNGVFDNNVNSQGSFIFNEDFQVTGNSSDKLFHIGSIISERMTVHTNIDICNIFDKDNQGLTSNLNWFDITTSGTGPLSSEAIPTQKIKVICKDVADCQDKMTKLNNL